ncbi:MAG: methyltransferase domain-containing protein [Rhodospirillaceae bacterium]|nr:methyltransferase domain-containing protein [Rhodospirillaceae bacterium]
MPEQPAPASTWTRAQIEDLLRRESFTYQAIKLPHGLSTSGHDRSGTAKLILPDDLSGQSVLDVGCSLGFFCFAARSRGAARVVGLDLEAENVRKARILADVLGEPVEFAQHDVEKHPIDGRFDHVLCLNVLHHLADPIGALDRLIGATRGRLVLELATFGLHDRRKLGIGWAQQLMLTRVPMMVVGRGAASEGIKQFYLTPPAVDNLLRFRRGCFASVEITPSDYKDRFIVFAHKRRIGHLIAVCGPAGSNRQDVIRRIGAGALPPLSGRLGADGPAPATLLADRYYEPGPAEHARLFFDYDILRPFTLGAVTFSHDPALEVLDTAETSTIVTLWAPPEQLTQGIEAEIAGAKGRARKRFVRAREEYQDARRLVRHYREWFDYCAGRSAEHVVLWMKDDGPAVMSPQEWEATVAVPLAGVA